MTTHKNIVRTSVTLFRIAIIVSIASAYSEPARAGGPKYVAGSTYFNSSTMGQPLTWSLGQVNYYTDQGDLSPILPNAAANAFVANSFSQWTSVSTATLTAIAAGQLAEDVNGSNISVDSDGVVAAPADITPEATSTPVGIVYDYDGTVTDALLGAGAGDASQCFWNAVFGGADNFGVNATFLHALVIVNGQCALQTSQLTDVEYRLVRVLGSVIGLDWSQFNLNVVTDDPPPTEADFAGFPIMHYVDPASCVPITKCYPYTSPYQLAPDDMAALSRLYPGSTSSTARIHGSVYFVDHTGGDGQPMQGVNVVARQYNPTASPPASRQYGASSVSGFLFTGNAGNPITGWTSPLGIPYSEFGSSNQSQEGFYDLGGLPLPNGASSVQYQLSVEAVDPLWSTGVGPYAPSQVAPSGAATVIVTVTAGGDVEQDILMSGSAQAVPSWAATETWNAPALIPAAGDWIGSLSGYGDVGYFLINAQANRTLSVAVTALDETAIPSESKVEPVVGMWTLGDALGTPPPALTTAPFNSVTFGMSRLDAQILNTNSFIVGISDLRGDGRPDYQYHAHVLYGDSALPARVPVSGGAVTLQGTGFAPGLAVSVATTSVPLLATNSSQMLIAAPPLVDGAQTIIVNDPISGASSTMTGVLTYGAAASDKFILLLGSNPPAPVGTQAVNPVTVQVVASDGVTPVNGATVAWFATNFAELSACGGAFSCSVITDEGGIASTFVTPATTGNAAITATLAPAVYNPAQSITATVATTASTSTGIGVTTPYLWISAGASLSVPITAHVVSGPQGTAQSGVRVDFFVDLGTGSLSAPSAVTDGNGNASVTLTLTNYTTSVQLSACVYPTDNPCQTVYGSAVTASMLKLQPVNGAGQVVSSATFQPLTIRVTDSSIPPHPVLAASVLFQSTVLRPVANDLIPASGNSGGSGMPVILSASQSSGLSDSNGLVNFTPSTGSFTGPLEIEIQASAGTLATLQDVMETFPGSSGGIANPLTSSLGNGSDPAARGDPLRTPRADEY